MTELQAQANAITLSLEKDQEFIVKLKKEMQVALMESSQQVRYGGDVQVRYGGGGTGVRYGGDVWGTGCIRCSACGNGEVPEGIGSAEGLGDAKLVASVVRRSWQLRSKS